MKESKANALRSLPLKSSQTELQQLKIVIQEETLQLSNDEIQDSLEKRKRIEFNQNLINWVNIAIDKGSKEGFFCVYPLLLDSLGNVDFTTAWKIYLEKDSKEALDYLNELENRGGFDEFEPISIFSLHLYRLNHVLAYQDNAAGIIALLKMHIDDPYLMAASLFWLYQKKMDALQIMESGLLHNFLGYHLHDLEKVTQLYELLNIVPDGFLILDIAEQTYYDVNKFGNLSLAGTLLENLQSASYKEPPLKITPHDENIYRLYEYFGTTFINESLYALATVDCRNLSDSLRKILGELESSKLHQLLMEFTRYQSGNKELLLESLATHLDDAIIQTLFAENTHALYLILFRPYFFMELITEQFRTILERIIKSQKDPLEQMLQLLTLLFIVENHPLLQFNSFKKIMKIALCHPNIAYNSYDLLYNLINFKFRNPNALDYLGLELMAKIKQLKEFIDSQLKISNLLTKELYNKIEDFWEQETKQTALISTILEQRNYYCPNVYALRVDVIKQMLEKKIDFDLESTVKLMTNKYQGESAKAHTKDTLLILLAYIEPLQEQAFTLLNKNRDWLTQDELHEFLQFALQNYKIDVIKGICRDKILETKKLTSYLMAYSADILIELIADDLLDLDEVFRCLPDNPNPDWIATLLEKIEPNSNLDHPSSLLSLIRFIKGKTPALNLTNSDSDYQLIQSLLSITRTIETLNEWAEKLLVTAVEQRDEKMFQLFADLQTDNWPDSKAFSKALDLAVDLKHNNEIQCLLAFPNCKPDPHIVYKVSIYRLKNSIPISKEEKKEMLYWAIENNYFTLFKKTLNSENKWDGNVLLYAEAIANSENRKDMLQLLSQYKESRTRNTIFYNRTPIVDNNMPSSNRRLSL